MEKILFNQIIMIENNKDIASMYTKKGNNSFFVVSTTIFLMVILITWLLFFIDLNIQNKIEKSNLTIQEKTQNIDDFKKKYEAKLIKYDIVKAQSWQIMENIQKSWSYPFFNKLYQLTNNYSDNTSTIVFEWFSFDGENINTSFSAINRDPNKDAITLVSRFIKDFRDSEFGSEDFVSSGTGKTNIRTSNEVHKIGDEYELVLSPINSVAWDIYKKTFWISFKINKQAKIIKQ